MNRYIYILVLFIFFSSCKKEDLDVTNKRFYYKRFQNDTLKGYTLRDYNSIADTLNERVVYLDLLGNVLDSMQRTKYIKIDNGLNIVFKTKGEYKMFPYIFTENKDSCYSYQHPLLGNVKNCYKGKVDLLNYKNLYKIKSTQYDMNGVSMNIYLDNDFTLVARDTISLLLPFDEEIRITDDKLSKHIIKVMESF